MGHSIPINNGDSMQSREIHGKNQERKMVKNEESD